MIGPNDVIHKNRYVWNKQKAESNIRKHGISFEKAVVALEDFFALDWYDEEHSDYEDRFYTIGYAGTLITVSFVMRNHLARIISAREADGEEEGAYNESIRRHIGER
jgi:uncharacterized DUF497 family protein